MSKNSKEKKSKELEKLNSSSTSNKLKQLLYITICVFAIFGMFYFITSMLVGDDFSKEETKETVVQNDEILIGSSFSLKDKEYYVLYCSKDDEESVSKLSTVIDNYRSSRKEPYVYTVDMSLGFNLSFKSDKSNRTAKNASELKINGVTLIKYSDGKIVDYIEGVDEILKIFS